MGIILDRARTLANDDVLSVRDVGQLLSSSLEDGRIDHSERKDLEKLTTELATEISPAARSAISRFLALGDVFDGNLAGQIFGVDQVVGDKLEKAGVRTVKELMISTRTLEGRAKIATDTGINLLNITNFTERADLSRVSGIGYKYAAILHGVGINNMEELRGQDPAQLYENIITFMRTDEGKAIARRRPSLEKVTQWVERATVLPEVLRYVGDEGANFSKEGFDALDNFKKFMLLRGVDVRHDDVAVFDASTLKVSVPRRKPVAITEYIQSVEQEKFGGDYDSVHLSSVERVKADNDTLGFKVVFEVSGDETYYNEGGEEGEHVEGTVTVGLLPDGTVVGADHDVWSEYGYE